MAHMAKSVGWALLAVLQIAIACWVAIVFGWSSQRMAHEKWANTATPEDWWWAAAQRFGTGLFWATVTGFLIWCVNRFLSRASLPISDLWPLLLAWAGFGIIAVASAIGALTFAIEKPGF
jgi:hypothetical protein